MLKVPKNAQKYILRSFYDYAADKFLNLMENNCISENGNVHTIMLTHIYPFFRMMKKLVNEQLDFHNLIS